MAVDTRDKRSSAINPSCPWRGQLPAPDTTVNQGDRQHTAGLYRGITASGTPIGALVGSTNTLFGGGIT